MMHKLADQHEIDNSNIEVLQIAEQLLINWAYEIQAGNLKNRDRYYSLLREFSHADINGHNMGLVRQIVNGYLKETIKKV